MRNVSRAWAYETGLAAGVELGPGERYLIVNCSYSYLPLDFSLEIPVNEYYEYFGPDYELDVKSSNADDLNTPAYLDRVKRIVMENLRHVGGPPGVPMMDIPSMPIDDVLDDPNRDEDFEDLDERRPQRLLDSRRQADGELSDSDDEGEGGRRNHMRHRSRDSVEDDGTNRKFGMGVGIMTSSTSTLGHGVGPSGHITATRILSTSHPDPLDMEIDTPPVATPLIGTPPTPLTIDMHPHQTAPKKLVIESGEIDVSTVKSRFEDLVDDSSSGSTI
ncbi:hypothetical protein C0993_012281 [Termitomyces sp. T159_Od127]|nr:hypothetical protein C0993_012281 [Termitomyces sp. T159_Od127]